MFFGRFQHSVSIPTISLDAIRELTDLAWVQVDRDAGSAALPSDAGVYVFADDNGAIFYIGKADGRAGLRRRVGNYAAWIANHNQRINQFFADPSEENGWRAAYESPTIRVAAERDLTTWYAVAKPATWQPVYDGDGIEIPLPASAVEWEAFLREVSHMVCGHRGLIGSGAWESKAGSLADRMEKIAWARLIAVNDGDCK